MDEPGHLGGTMRVLVTGGAGFIGSIIVEKLVARGSDVEVIDSLRTGHREAVPAGVPFHKVDLQDRAALREVLVPGRFNAVMHFAAISLVGDSVKDPSAYYQNNIVGTLNLLDSLVENNISSLVFSSTAAVYGEPESVPIDEQSGLRPTSPYGSTKLAMEDAIRWYGGAYGLRSVVLRYFNAAGATQQRGEDHRPETHLIPRILHAALKGGGATVFGTDYPTRDQTAVRDYVHVEDLADAHLRALDRLVAGGNSLTCNLGSSTGATVREVLAVAREVTGAELPETIFPRRAGDPAVLIASNSLAKSELGWAPTRELPEMVASAWAWLKAHPQGY